MTASSVIHRSSRWSASEISVGLEARAAPSIGAADGHRHSRTCLAPLALYAYQAQLIASRGFHGKGKLQCSDEEIVASAADHVALLGRMGIDRQLISPRPFAMMHSHEPEKIVHWFIEQANDVIARQVAAYPDVFTGVAGLPQNAGVSPANVVAELERCINELGFVGCVLNPDPGEGDGKAPTLGDEHWYPLYEKMVELDVPGLIHSAGCRSHRESYSNHFITEESIAILSLVESRVFEDSPRCRLIVSHGGGSIPYQIGRWRGPSASRRARGRSTRTCAGSGSTPSSTTRSRWTSCCASSAPTAASSAPRRPASARRSIRRPAGTWTTSAPSSRRSTG